MRGTSVISTTTGWKMRPFSEFSEGKDWFISLLKAHNFTDILDTDTISRFYRWDVEATSPEGIRYAFELKNRSFPSTTFGDAAVNYDKYEKLTDCPYKAVLVMFWPDCFILIDVKSCPPDNDITRDCARTTRFRDHTRGDNKMARWYIQDRKVFDYDQV